MDANNLEEFRAGVSACLRSWSALRTAVESGWGGGERESQNKAEGIRQNIFQTMNGSKCPLPNYDEQDLADSLAIFMEEEFSVTLEDGSENQVAEVIFRMYVACARGDTSLARHMISTADSAVTFNSQFPIHVQTTEHDDDDEMDMDCGTPSTTQVTSPSAAVPLDISTYNSIPLFGAPKNSKVYDQPVRQLGETETEKPVEEMDEDGFAPVKPKGRRKR